MLQNFNYSLRKIAKDLGISHVYLIKEIKNNPSEYGYDAKLAWRKTWH
ncbi:hypothetical protein [Mycoplasmopsis synoviae]|nr:hypothetical protein [Mycoplasmopsis synoviae]AKJ20958.1 hypothetical protein MSHv_04960 [Mycoplasmopsis synoviae]AKJ21065.1 hypothetical protein MSHv_06050 [Mycoplasmopsis synoviae]AQU48293.1 hypothetical protein ADF19_04960 [Mycoplasmopsis synoviae]AQU48402.1 hypothetical protein ADF19_06050 [Mycoplasmopsis synoviae]UZF65703.1 hypothetical protein N0B74_00205 [Mycoplasmopsis synoviae]